MSAPRAALLVALLAIAPYAGSLGAPLVGDDRTLVGSPWVQREVGIVSAFTHDYWYGTRHEGLYLYRPVTVLSLAANARWASSRVAFRGVNVALHALAALAALWALRGVFGAREGEASNDRRPALAAAFGAGVFAVHPLASEAVLMSVGRAETIAAAAGLAAFRLMLDLGRERSGRWRLPTAAALFALALFAKESAATWLLIGTLGTAVLAPHRNWKIAAGVFAAVFGAYLAVRGSVVGGATVAIPAVDNPLAPLGAATRAANAILLLGRYALEALWPATLSVEYGFDQITPRPLAAALPGALALAGAWAALAAWLFRRDRAAGFLAVFPLAAFSVTANVLFPIGTIFAERLAYVPLAGVCGLAGWAVTRPKRPGWLPFALAAALAVPCAARTHARGGDFRDIATLHAATVEASPRAVKALFNLARTRIRQGRSGEAVALLEKAVALRPDYERARALLDAVRGAPNRPGSEDEEP